MSSNITASASASAWASTHHSYSNQPSSLPRASTVPTLKTKPSSTRLTPRHIPSSSLSPPTTSSPSLLRSKTESSTPTSLPLANNTRLKTDNSYSSSSPKRSPSALAKAVSGPSSLPKQMTSMPTVNFAAAKSKTSHPTKQHSTSGTTSKTPSSIASVPTPDKRVKNVIRKNSASNNNTLPLPSLRTGSTTSGNGSTASITSTSSMKDSRSGSVLGISLPATSLSSAPLMGSHYTLSTRARSGSASSTTPMPKLSTSNLQTPLNNSGVYSSASSVQYESPGNFSITSTPTSTSSHSPGFAPPGFRLRTHSPSRPPVTRNRSGSITQPLNANEELAKKGLDSVRESTTSTSSDSTIRASEHNQKRPVGSISISEEKKTMASPSIPNLPTPLPTPKSDSSRSFTTSQVKGAICSLPIWNLSPFSPRIASPPSTASSPALGSIRSKSSNSVPTRPSRERTPELNAAGLGVTIPVIHSNLTAGPGSLARTRSKSTGTVGMHLPQTKVSATPPPTSPGISQNTASTRRPSESSVNDLTSPTIGFPYSNATRAATPVTTSPQRKRSNSNERSREKSPTRASPGKLTRPGFFSTRRAKTSDGDLEKAQKRGPAAGTGHEGYGKYAKIRGRGRSTSTVGSTARSGSVSSLSDSNTGSRGRRSGSKESKSDMDEFLLNRKNPVVIAGGGDVVENQNVGAAGYRVRQGSFSEGGTAGGVEMSRDNSQSSVSNSPRGGRESSTERRRIGRRAPTPIPINTGSSLPVKHDPMPSRKPDLASAFTPPMGAQDTFIITNIYDPMSPPLMTDPLPVAASRSTSKATKGRWGFLRGKTTAAPAAPAAQPPVSASAVNSRTRPAHYIMMDSYEQQTAKQAELIFRILRKNPLKDGETSGTTTMTSGSGSEKKGRDSVLLPEPPLPLRNVSPIPYIPSSQPTLNSPPSAHTTTTQSQPGQASKLMPAFVPTPSSSETSKQEAKEKKMPQNFAQGMRSPLTQTTSKQHIPKPGQIPLGHRSRPSDGQIQMKPVGAGNTRRPVLGLKTSLPKHFMTRGNEALSAPAHVGPRGVFERNLKNELQAKMNLSPPSATTAEIAPIKTSTLIAETSSSLDKGKRPMANERWPPRKDSVSQRTSEDSGGREIRPARMNLPPVMILPALPVQTQESEDADDEDDVWDEYNDIEAFIGSSNLSQLVEIPKRAKGKAGWKSNTSSLGSPFHYDDLEAKYRALTESEDKKKTIRSLDSPTLPERMDSSGSSCRTISTCFEISPRSTICSNEGWEFAGSSSRIMPPPRIKVEPFNADIRSVDRVLVPDTPFSVTSFIRYYGSSDRDSRCYSTFEPSIPQDIGMNENAGTAKLNKSNHTKNSSTSTTASSSAGSVGTILEPRGLENEMKVRLWALMASRWLSFDRVLVSPAHEQLVGMQTLNTLQKARILIVDGLGTDDWSFYCALTYPCAEVYNLSPSTAAGNGNPNGEVDTGKPSNHKQISHSSFDMMYPFPSDFFDVVSFRFLPSSSYPNLPFILSECKRVLAPGGYLETSVLDADLLNMGNRTQRAVDLNKGIMERECEEYETIAGHGSRRAAAVAAACTKPISERITRLLEKGFVGVNRCLLSLPVVGSVGDASKNGSVDLRSPRPSGDSQDLMQQSATTATSTNNLSKGAEPDDAQINEVVSKVGRWWYTRCYERVITGEGEAPGRSMWNDRALIRECGKKGTRFRMLISYARKPLPIQIQLGSPADAMMISANEIGKGKAKSPVQQ